jgi:hypothetical protein
LFGLADALELHYPVDQGKESIVAADANIDSGMHFGSSLTYEDASGCDLLTAKRFDAEPLGIAIAPVLTTTACFFMSHVEPPMFRLLSRTLATALLFELYYCQDDERHNYPKKVL